MTYHNADGSFHVLKSNSETKTFIEVINSRCLKKTPYDCVGINKDKFNKPIKAHLKHKTGNLVITVDVKGEYPCIELFSNDGKLIGEMGFCEKIPTQVNITPPISGSKKEKDIKVEPKKVEPKVVKVEPKVEQEKLKQTEIELDVIPEPFDKKTLTTTPEISFDEFVDSQKESSLKEEKKPKKKITKKKK